MMIMCWGLYDELAVTGTDHVLGHDELQSLDRPCVAHTDELQYRTDHVLGPYDELNTSTYLKQLDYGGIVKMRKCVHNQSGAWRDIFGSPALQADFFTSWSHKGSLESIGVGSLSHLRILPTRNLTGVSMIFHQLSLESAALEISYI